MCTSYAIQFTNVCIPVVHVYLKAFVNSRFLYDRPQSTHGQGPCDSEKETRPAFFPHSHGSSNAQLYIHCVVF